MPYELSFTKRLVVTDREQYINECCIGGDVIVERLLPAVRQRYADVQSEQEDWGWFIWFRKDRVKLAIDVFTDDPDAGDFRIHLTSRKKGLLFEKVEDTAELEELRALVLSELSAWTDSPVTATPIDRD